MVRLAVARLWFCANSFNPRRTRLADLQRHEWTEGPSALLHRGAAGPAIEGVAAFLALRPHWDAVMLRCAAAPPGGPLTAEVFGTWMSDVGRALRPGRFDALYLSLHGACQAEGDPQADLTVLRHLRRAAGRLPIVASFDSRANISDEVPLLLDGASATRGPDDGAAASARALTMLEGLLAGRIRPVGAVSRLAAIMPPGQVRRVMEQVWHDELAMPRAPLLDASVFSGFAWADTASAGPSAMAWADRDAGAARDAAAGLASRLAGRRQTGTQPSVLVAAGTLAAAARHGPVLLLDRADDPDAGGAGDTPGLIRVVLAHAAAAAVGVLADPPAVAAAHAAGGGAVFEHPLGAWFSPAFGPPVMARVRVARLLSGMAVLQAGPVAILVAERPTLVAPALLQEAGIDPGGLRVLAVKGGDPARAAFADAFPVVLDAPCPGPSSHDLAALPFANVPASRRAGAALQARAFGSARCFASAGGSRRRVR